MANRYDSFDNGAPTEDRLKFSKTNVGYSAHNFSCTHAGNYVLGMLAPIDCFDVVPSEKLDMSISAVLAFRNPTTRKLFNGFRTFFHCRYNRFIDLWEGARNFIDHGRSGKIDLSRPNAIYYNDSGFSISESVTVNKVNANTPMSLLNFLGLPPEALQQRAGQFNRSRPPLRQFQTASKITGGNYSNDFTTIGNHTSFFPADCLMAYQRNWRDFYANKNLLQNNKYWFPDNEDHFILSYSCGNAVCINYENEDFASYPSGSSQNEEQCKNLCDFDADDMIYTPESNNPASVPPSGGYSSGIYAPNLAGIKFVQMRGDRFTTASPFPDLLRGDIPVLQLTQDNFVRLKNTSNNSSYPINGQSSSNNALGNVSLGQGTTPPVSLGLSNVQSGTNFALTTPESSVTMSDLYTLETLTAFKRKLGMTNGDYNESIEAMFGRSPKVHDRRGTYVGGFYIDWNQDGVIQQSESNSTPLGTKAGIGMASGSGSLGHFEVPDFGWIQTYMFTVSDVYYTQGKPRQYSKSQSIDLYFPLFNNLPAQAIRNDELFISGTAATDALPFAYEDRYAEYKGRHNRVSGFMGLSHALAEYDASRIMARRFTSVPSLNSQFVTYLPENTDMDVFAVNDEPPIDFNVAIQVRRVFPGPYMAIEGSLSSPALN